MAKSIKLKNNTYIDSTSISHNKRKLSEILDEKSFIVVYLTANQAISQGVYDVKFARNTILGDCFELTNNGRIRVKKACNAIISGNCFVDGAGGDGYCWGEIFVNGYVQTSQLERIINRDYVNTSIPAKAVNLKENDEIYMRLDYACTIGNPVIRNQTDTTFLSVIKI